MGDGDHEIVVDSWASDIDALEFGNNYELAIQEAESYVASQTASTDNGDVVIFYRPSEYPRHYEDFSLKASETEWRQHNYEHGLFSTGREDGEPSTAFRIISADATEVERLETFSIDELHEHIEAKDALLREGEGIEGWKECIRNKYSLENRLRKHMSIYGEGPHRLIEKEPISSGQLAGFTLHSSDRLGGNGYARMWPMGDDASFFQIVIVEGGQVITPDDHWATRNQITHYDVEFRTTRPLPAGLYEIEYHSQSPTFIPCNYIPPHSIWKFTFEFADGVLHEALFDPVDIDEAVGADGENGTLEPEGFEYDDLEASIEDLRWQDGQVELVVEFEDDFPGFNAFGAFSSFGGNHIDFIDLDGSVVLRLDFDDAVEMVNKDDVVTFVWGVCEQPWQAGDLLMLRIAESSSDYDTEATSNPECLTATPEPTATPTPELIATPEPMPESRPYNYP